MKKPDVLNRSMFNRGGTSAYGRGITSNLVSDEQRQRFNYGGRVGLWQAGGVGIGSPWADIDPAKRDPMSFQNTWGRLNVTPQSEAVREHLLTNEEREEAYDRSLLADLENPEDYAGAVEEKIIPPPPELKTDPKSDVIDWETWAEGLYDKKSAKGEAQLGLAGNVLAAAFQPKKEAMAILGKGLGDFGKTATQRKKKMEDIAATGKMYETIYKTRATEKGKQDRLTAAAKTATDTPSNLFWGHLDAAKLKGNLKDKDYAYAYERASNKPTQIIKKEEDKAAIEANPEQFKDTVFVMGTSFLKLDNAGKLKDITQEIFESFKG